MAPGTLVLATARSLLIPHISNSASVNPSAAFKATVKLCFFFTGAMTVLAITIVMIPDGLGRAMLGESWKHAKPVLPPLAGELVFASITAVAFAAHRVYESGIRGLKIEASLAPIRLGSIVLSGVYWGPTGAAYAMLAIAAIGAVCWWISFRSITMLVAVAEPSSESSLDASAKFKS
jgi:hypothetical protein